MNRKKKGRQMLLGMIGMLFLISAAVTLTLACRPLYLAEMKWQHLEEQTGFSEKEILENYEELIAYNLSPFQRELKFPTFSMSEEARIHFREVKRIFQGFQGVLAVTLITMILAVVFAGKSGDWRFLEYTGIFSVIIPAGCAGLLAWNWDRVFVMFHELLFQNDYWLFDPVTDPVILILPDAYFLHCAILIIGLVLAGAAGFFGLGQYLKKKQILRSESE